MIEFVAPNESAFGLSEAADFVGFDGHELAEFGDDPPRSPWLAALAGVVVTALIAGGVIAAAPWDHDATAQPVPTTVPGPSTTTPAPTTTREQTLTEQLNGAATFPVGWLIDGPLPGGLQMVQAYSQKDGWDQGPSQDWIDVWSSGGATRTTGTWLAVSSMTGQGDYEPMLADATRVDFDGRPALLSRMSDAAFQVHFVGTDETQYEMAGFGFTIDELVRIASTISRPGDDIGYGDLAGPGGPLEGLGRPVSKAVPWGGFTNSAQFGMHAQSTYYDPDTEAFVAIAVDEFTVEADVLSQLILEDSTQAAKGGFERVIDINTTSGGRRTITIGALHDYGERTVLRWNDGDQVITMSGSGMEPTELVAMAAAARPSEADEWRDLVIETQNGFDSAPSEPITNVSVGRGTLTDGRTWQAEVYSAATASLNIYSDTFGGGFLLTDRPLPDLRTFSTPTTTFVTATSAWPGTAQTMRVTLTPTDGSSPEPVEVPLVQIGDTTTYMAVHGFSEVGGGTAELLDADGKVVATAAV